MADSDLAQLARSGNDEAAWVMALRMEGSISFIIDNFLRPFHGNLFGTLSKEDLWQVAFLSCFQAAKLWDPNRSSFVSYITTCVRNQIHTDVGSSTTVFTLDPRQLQNIYEFKQR
jgi:DNA-directed RNA polymerase specialized sigma subunit